MKRLQLVIEDGEITVLGLPDGWSLEGIDFDAGETLEAGFTERDRPVPPDSGIEWDDGAPFIRYDIAAADGSLYPDPSTDAGMILALLAERLQERGLRWTPSVEDTGGGVMNLTVPIDDDRWVAIVTAPGDPWRMFLYTPDNFDGIGFPPLPGVGWADWESAAPYVWLALVALQALA